MAYLIRLYHTSSWTQRAENISNVLDIDANSIGDLAVRGHTISTWFVDNGNTEDIDKAVVALASCFKTMDPINVVLIDANVLDKNGFLVKKTTAKSTKIRDFADLHRDIQVYTTREIINLTQIILKEINQNNVKFYNIEQIIVIMLRLINQGILDFNELEYGYKKGMIEKVKKMLKGGRINEDQINDKIRMYIENNCENSQLNNRNLYVKPKQKQSCV